ncbi:MAG: NUDIX domain-containing protein [Pseudomonadota bacterium]
MFCTACGALLPETSIKRDFRPRCPACGARQIQHPSVVLTCFIACDDKLLLIKRALPPQVGFWAIPGGFMEAGETTAEGAARELREEAGVHLQAETLSLYMAGSITFLNQVYIAYRATVSELACAPGVEAQAAQFFSRDECPWRELAYPEVNDAIRQAYDDLERGEFGTYHAEMTDAFYRLRPVRTQ